MPPTPFRCATRARVLLAHLLLAASAAAQTAPAAVEAPPPAAAIPGRSPVESSVVRVYATLRSPDPTRPWTRLNPREVTGSGVVIDGQRILTNAHVVSYASQLQVQGSQSGDKVIATVEHVAPGMDLAILRVADTSFFEGRPALERATTAPRVRDAVTVYGFPTGGTSLSITQGIVSRVEFTRYNYPLSGLRMQIDAAINPGNSGGPAVVGEKLIGIAFSVLANSQNIGYLIPVEEVEIFLRDVADGRYDGKPTLHDDFQNLENAALRAFLKVDRAVQGIVVREPYRNDSGYPLKRWDVVTRIGNFPIDNQGNVSVTEANKVRFLYAVQRMARDGRVPITVIRGGQTLTLDLPVVTDRPKLIPFLQGGLPDYFILGPVVFAGATEDFVAAITNPNVTGGPALAATLALSDNPLITRRGDQPAFAGEQLVVISSPFFSHPLSQGYGSPVLRVLATLNDKPVKSLRHLVEMVRDSRDEQLTFAFAGSGGENLVFPRQEMLAATEQILNDNGIRTQGSPEIMAVWGAK